MQILWIGKVFSYVQSTLILIILLSIHFTSFDNVIGYLGSDIVWLVFATYIISNAFMKSGLAERFSLLIIRLSKGSGKVLLLMSYVLMLILAVIIPSNIGRTSLIASSLDQLIKRLIYLTKVDNIARGMFVGVAILSGLSGVLVTTGASSTIYTYGLLNKASTIDITYIQWVLFFSLPVLIFVFALWIMTLYMFPVEEIDKAYLVNYIDTKISELGKVSRNEINMLIIIGSVVALWVFHDEFGLSISMIGILGALLTLLPLIGVWDWGEAKNYVNWEMILFFASTLMLSNILIDSGLLTSFARFLMPLFQDRNIILIVFIIVLVVMLLRIIFVNVLGFLTIMIPLAIKLSEQLSLNDPTLFIMAIFLAGVPGFFLVTQSPSHIISYTYNYFTAKDLFKVGTVLSAVWLIIIMFSVFVYWPLLI